jgi:2'-5' RNA ligase superfamily protein
MPAHVTILYPFLSPNAIARSVERDLELALAPFPPFRFRLVRVERFPGVLYLEPDPAHQFVELTSAVHARWPNHPPYGGAFADVIPHLTVVQGREPPELAHELEKALPIEAEASEVCLMAQRGRKWSLVRRFPLGVDRTTVPGALDDEGQ